MHSNSSTIHSNFLPVIPHLHNAQKNVFKKTKIHCLKYIKPRKIEIRRKISSVIKFERENAKMKRIFPFMSGMRSMQFLSMSN